MRFVMCEVCLKSVEKEKAKTFEDKDWFEHYTCSDEHLIQAMLQFGDKARVTEMEVAA